MKRVRYALLIAIVSLIAVMTFFTSGLIVGGLGGYRVATTTVETEDAKAEYYRGVYDICIQQTRKVTFCLETVRRITHDGWYEKPSPGWDWPPAMNASLAKIK